MKVRIRPSANLMRWFTPGLHVKRWLLLLFVAVVMISLAAGYLLRDLYSASIEFPPWVQDATLQFLPRSDPRPVLRARRRRAHRARLLQAEPVDPGAIPPRARQHGSRPCRAALQVPLACQGSPAGRDRWRHRALRAAQRREEVHRQHRGDRHRRRRRWFERTPARGISRPPTRRHPAVPDRARRDRATDDRAVPVPVRRRGCTLRALLRESLHHRDGGDHRRFRARHP